MVFCVCELTVRESQCAAAGAHVVIIIQNVSLIVRCRLSRALMFWSQLVQATGSDFPTFDDLLGTATRLSVPSVVGLITVRGCKPFALDSCLSLTCLERSEATSSSLLYVRSVLFCAEVLCPSSFSF